VSAVLKKDRPLFVESWKSIKDWGETPIGMME
jgi:hypothetical protein